MLPVMLTMALQSSTALRTHLQITCIKQQVEVILGVGKDQEPII